MDFVLDVEMFVLVSPSEELLPFQKFNLNPTISLYNQLIGKTAISWIGCYRLENVALPLYNNL